MPEGPSILILKEAVSQFKGQEVLSAEGNASIDFSMIEGKKIKSFKTWGKHFLICFDRFTIRIHMLMFGTYAINVFKDKKASLSLQFKTATLTFYTCAVKWIDGDLDEVYDWKADVLSDDWSPAKAKTKLKQHPDGQVCDVLLDQEIFAGVGNIIKNEILYRIQVHPASIVGALPPGKFNALVKEARIYSFDFLEWKKEGVLKKHWKAYNQKVCERCDLPIKKEIMGKTKRGTFFCPNCQILYQSGTNRLL